GSLLGEIVVGGFLSQAEALIALLHQRDDVVRGHLVALRLGERGGKRGPRRLDEAHRHRGRRDARELEEAAATHAPRHHRLVSTHAQSSSQGVNISSASAPRALAAVLELVPAGYVVKRL